MTTQTKALKALPNDLIDELLASYQNSEDLIGENGLLKQLTKALVERALQAKITEHLGHVNTPLSVAARAMRVTAKAIKPSKVGLANCPSKSHVTVRAVLSRNSSPSTKHVGLVLMTRLSRSTRAA